MDVKGKVLLQLFYKNKLRNGNINVSRAKNVLYSQFKKLLFSSSVTPAT